MKRKEKEAYWSTKIDEYQKSGLALSEWCETAEVAVHNMKYWLRKQSPVNHTAHQETQLIFCLPVHYTNLTLLRVFLML
ncbi:IS66 family insertion sequence element accessory protein TnpA [Sporosarcina ureae]|uniref:Transposase n=1 Tax=Sporosarcina ureae TaxID=1571 RepID=A0ABM6JY26_SPOUR|nr:hypothetical protein [Sporosarcina ureae]ARF15081.1 hypothetical protein SporoS204_13530 [Sporosarcina ureae]